MKHVILFFFLTSLILQSCKKDKRNITTDDPVLLRDKSVAEVRVSLVGNWKIHHTYGYGYSGFIKTPTPNSYFKVLANDSVYLSFNNNITAAGIATYQRKNTEFNFSAVIIEFPIFGGPNSQWIYDYNLKDSLVLTSNRMNSESYTMTKIP
ncbi:hypothetical protein [Pedobacter alpinus]|uniref:Lipocalin-like domain-containing protein n=1 Tax=Pedobacter alpinus TaxID=1590643 RepID=A0ABW5TTY9_9SPHI